MFLAGEAPEALQPLLGCQLSPYLPHLIPLVALCTVLRAPLTFPCGKQWHYKHCEGMDKELKELDWDSRTVLSSAAFLHDLA